MAAKVSERRRVDNPLSVSGLGTERAREDFACLDGSQDKTASVIRRKSLLVSDGNKLQRSRFSCL